jgi:hypothetical protein
MSKTEGIGVFKSFPIPQQFLIHFQMAILLRTYEEKEDI